MGKIQPPVDQICRKVVGDASKCRQQRRLGVSGDSRTGNSRDGDRSESDRPCKEVHYQLKKCKKAVVNAYHHINLGGCAKKIQDRMVCEQEWCVDADDNEAKKKCQVECKVYRHGLEECIEYQVKRFLLKSGFRTSQI
eukprot:CAMPEP_0172503574 /NCGR_PEP_ID=MMETSP1066-20121228/170568_1 /TAXON_ID=671091 /ORGANISM="Coscinodiscus wailesii, Strain CCMP2513" /LENGTH=137 /DNA_ID=CAMNT_0013279371 /DNA_START=149 /DNA_END=562 /DNA_ORIENTATION=+